MTAARKKRSSRRRSPRSLLPLLALALVVIAVVLWWALGGRVPAGSVRADFGQRLVELAAERGATPDDIAADDPIRKVDGVFVRFWRIAVPNRTALEALAEDVERTASGWPAPVERLDGGTREAAHLRVDLGTEAIDLELRVAPGAAPVERAAASPTPAPTPTATPRPQPRPDARGRLAILLDDGGQSMDLVTAAAALPPEVAVSILPFLPYSAETATELDRAGHEVWLHLPMEPEPSSDGNPGPGAVLTTMTDAEIRATVHSALNNIPNVVGVNNHMGSKATADLRTMTWVMQELKARDVAFIDSRTTVHTVAESAARAQGIPTGRRHVFLDNRREAGPIRRQLDEAVYLARLNGEAIAIGHLADVTVRVLEDELPKLDRRGVTLVRPTKLVK